MLLPLAGHGLRPTPLRQHAGRPQLKRDPLGGYLHKSLTTLALIVTACSQKGGREAPASSPQATVQQAPDPSADTLLVTADRMGRVRSCALLADIRRAYPRSRDTLTPTEDPELHQAGVVVDLAPGERLLYVASWSDSSHAWTLSTTSPRFHTARGLHVGSRYAHVLSTGDSIEFEFPEGQVVATIIPEGVSFMVDERSAASFYSQAALANVAGKRELMDSNARIIELFSGRACRK